MIGFIGSTVGSEGRTVCQSALHVIGPGNPVLDPLSRRRLYAASHPAGAIAQLGERLNGIQEVRGSTPLGSTNLRENSVF